MTLTLLDLYNTAASQEWAMYDNDAATTSEMEDSLVLALNKAIHEIYSSHDFPFRERTHVIITIPKVDAYDMPTGMIKRDKNGDHIVKYNSSTLLLIENPSELISQYGIPKGFYVRNDQLVLYPTPAVKGLVTIDYYTLVIGESASGEEIYSLKNANDVLTVPAYLEELIKEAIITRTMLNSIASETDENYSAYKKQADKAYKLLVKYSKGVMAEKYIRF